MIFVGVGTFRAGFDALVAAADDAAARLGLDGLAQIGHGAVLPTRLRWTRFLPHAELLAALAAARLVVCHGGMGLLGEAMRAGRPIIAVPRRGATSRAHPANDQSALIERLSRHYGIRACPEPEDLTAAIGEMLAAHPDGRVAYPLGSNTPMLIAGFLAKPLGC